MTKSGESGRRKPGAEEQAVLVRLRRADDCDLRSKFIEKERSGFEMTTFDRKANGFENVQHSR